MARRTLELTDDLYLYLQRTSLREPALFTRLREETCRRNDAAMQISPEQGQFMRLLTELTGARRAIEIGTYTGYSALAVATALPSTGQLITCDIDPATTRIARRYWQEAGLADRIELRLGPAIETLDDLISTGAAAFDFGFIDADKVNYSAYFERLLKLMRPGGLILIDNVLWGGAVIDPDQSDDDTEAIRRFNESLHRDDRVSISMLPLGDGVTLARVRL